MPLGILWTPTYRGAGGGGPVPYDFTLDTQADSGSQIVGFSFFLQPPTIYDGNGNGTGRDNNDYVGGFSFPTVNLVSCSSATFTIDLVTPDAGGTFLVHGERNDSAPSAQYSASNLPSASFAKQTTATATGNVNSPTGLKVISVTTIIQEIMGTAFWASGQRINLFIEATSSFAYGDFGYPPATGTPARLEITP